MTQTEKSSEKESPKRILITMGDPSGIGPEIICKALINSNLDRSNLYAVVGVRQILELPARRLEKPLKFENLGDPGELFRKGGSSIQVLEPEGTASFEFEMGRPQATCGDVAFRCITSSIKQALANRCDAVVTAPICKEALHAAGHTKWPGHTEIFRDLTGAETSALMLIADRFRVIHVTNHIALSETPSLIKKDRIVDVIKLASDSLMRIDNRLPRLAVASFNPHAGEGGLFGREEIDEIVPAVQEAERLGFNVQGPFPPDTIFPKMVGGVYDGVIAMYHDQGHIAFKLHNFRYNRERDEWDEVTGVNVTLGLPIIRTSVDHGTAFDLAGTGKASERSLLDAIHVASLLAGQSKKEKESVPNGS